MLKNHKRLSQSDRKGASAERFVAEYYRKNGYKILDVNYRSRHGELDIVALKKDILAIIEVKARAENSKIPIEFSVTTSKQNKIKNCTLLYVQQHDLDHAVRFDVVLVTLIGGEPGELNIIENAFH